MLSTPLTQEDEDVDLFARVPKFGGFLRLACFSVKQFLRIAAKFLLPAVEPSPSARKRQPTPVAMSLRRW
jgi:hypothetical protein